MKLTMKRLPLTHKVEMPCPGDRQQQQQQQQQQEEEEEEEEEEESSFKADAVRMGRRKAYSKPTQRTGGGGGGQFNPKLTQ